MAAGSGEPGSDQYHSLVLYHNNSPRWAEQIKLPLPVDMFRGSHVRFEFRHCSSKYLDRVLEPGSEPRTVCEPELEYL